MLTALIGGKYIPVAELTGSQGEIAQGVLHLAAQVHGN